MQAGRGGRAQAVQWEQHAGRLSPAQRERRGWGAARACTACDAWASLPASAALPPFPLEICHPHPCDSGRNLPGQASWDCWPLELPRCAPPNLRLCVPPTTVDRRLRATPGLRESPSHGPSNPVLCVPSTTIAGCAGPIPWSVKPSPPRQQPRLPSNLQLQVQVDPAAVDPKPMEPSQASTSAWQGVSRGWTCVQHSRGRVGGLVGRHQPAWRPETPGRRSPRWNKACTAAFTE